MTKKLYMVRLKGAQDPEDRVYKQPVRAAKAEWSGETLIFTNADGTLSAFLMHQSWIVGPKSKSRI